MENDSWHVVGPNYPLNKWKYHWCYVLNPPVDREQQSALTAFWLVEYKVRVPNSLLWWAAWELLNTYLVIKSLFVAHVYILNSIMLYWQDNTVCYWRITRQRHGMLSLSGEMEVTNTVKKQTAWHCRKFSIVLSLKSRTWIMRTYSVWIREKRNLSDTDWKKKISPIQFSSITSIVRHKHISAVTSKYIACYSQIHTTMRQILF